MLPGFNGAHTLLSDNSLTKGIPFSGTNFERVCCIVIKSESQNVCNYLRKASGTPKIDYKECKGYRYASSCILHLLEIYNNILH